MMRGGGGGAGGAALAGQAMEMLRAVSSHSAADISWFILGLALMVLLILLIGRTQPAPAPRAARSTTCLICNRPLSGRVFIDRYFANWIVCGGCFDRLAPLKQRQYRSATDDQQRMAS